MHNINVLIVEDEPLIAEDIRMFLGNIDFSVAGVAYTSSQALDYLANRGPDAVLLDISIKGDMDGIDIAEIINEKYQIPFIYLTSHSDEHTVERAKHTLPYGYIVKPFDERDLLTSLEMAVFRHAQQHKQGVVTIADINRRIHTPLTEKEFEIMNDICAGLTNKQMAEKNFNSVNTIKFHIKNIFLKMDVSNRTSAIATFRGLADSNSSRQ